MAAVTYLEAISQGIWEEMERDPAVFCIGEDIGIYGGAFKVTDGLIDRFGPERVVDTPISEMAIINASFGAALTGMRPVAEFQFMDFISCAFNQINNMLAKAHYRWGAPVPVVVLIWLSSDLSVPSLSLIAPLRSNAVTGRLAPAFWRSMICGR